MNSARTVLSGGAPFVRRVVYNAIDFLCQPIFFALPAGGHPPDPAGADFYFT
jgi:hypothetical protein